MFEYEERKDGGANIYKEGAYCGQIIPIYGGVALKLTNGRDYFVSNKQTAIETLKSELS
ncbi:hypothetical protein MM326_18890 [Alkalihalobacillus sp. LMS6]|uniref:hypothetical protein n=1 Tax=Alkalihalobacillus sp. LMS6 TaxID=2924034 RepID=UPI0020D0833E|nr:hypothetical protein [Alkalihalobacillus sp. LMS6]UTR06117.1 hypothetical protein MM326_18890 [Alkalihalobacillus sp. LMS6]